MPRWPTGKRQRRPTEEMDLTHLIGHPEALNKETLFELRSLLARHPYYQPARLLLLQNLFLLKKLPLNLPKSLPLLYLYLLLLLPLLHQHQDSRLSDVRCSVKNPSVTLFEHKK